MSRILVTGGTGHFGRAFAEYALYLGAADVVLFSRSEERQRATLAELHHERLSGWIGDVRDLTALRACLRAHPVDTIIHAAAMKSVPACEQFPAEAAATNVTGTVNVLEAAAEAGVPRVVALSSDKACHPSSVYGATKAVLERLVMAGGRKAARFGNLIGSTGSVIPVWRAQRDRGEPITVTDPNMTRFYMKTAEAVRFVHRVVLAETDGAVYVPKLKACRLADLADVVSANQRVIGIRPGEREHETLLTSDECVRDEGWAYLVTPDGKPFNRVYRSSLVGMLDPLDVLEAA